MKRLTWAVLALFVLEIYSQGQVVPAAEISAQYSPLYVLKGYTIWNNGVSASASKNVTNWLGFVGDFGVYRGHVPEALTGETYMAGPRIAYRRLDRIAPFAQDLFFQALFGGSHFSESTGGITGGESQFTFALGAVSISASAACGSLPCVRKWNMLASARQVPPLLRFVSLWELSTASSIGSTRYTTSI